MPESIGQLTSLTTLYLNNNRLTVLPDSIAQLTSLTTLQLNNNWLSVLPESIAQLTSLTTLLLDNNRLTVLPESIGQLTSLTRLDLDGNGLTALPNSIGQLTSLDTLYLNTNGLTALPESIGQLTSLDTLYLNNNRLTVLPESIGQLTSLTTLYLENNGLTVLPESIVQLTSLTALYLNTNGLTALPDSIGQLTSLTTLQLNINELTALPDSIGQLTPLTTLQLNNNWLTVLPESIAQLTSLTTLLLDDNRLTVLPESIGQLTSLTRLDLDGNGLTALPNSIGQLTSLDTLYLNDNRLTVLPESIVQLTSLTALYLNTNGLTALPESIVQLTSLTALYLGSNRLTELPNSIGQLTSLDTLYLDSNQLTELPESIGQLTALTTLQLSANSGLCNPPREIQAMGGEAVVVFLRAVAEAPVERWASKVLVVGEASVGKTSLVKRLFGEAFDPDELQTHGLRVRPLPLPHPGRAQVEMALDVWDFGGQLEYRATQRFYLTDRSLFLLVWNARARSDDGKVIAWLDVITARAPDAPILIVATHGDEGSPAALPHDLGDRYPSLIGIHTIDSRTGLGIDDLRRDIASRAAALPLMGIRWPATWDAAARALGRLRERTVTTHRAFEHLALAGVEEPTEQQAIARMLHDLGQIAYFADIPGLDTKILLKPWWLDAQITLAIDSDAVKTADGVLSRAERRRLWQDLADAEDDPDLPDRLIRMMEAFDLAYRTGDPDQSEDVALIVDRLPLSPPPDLERVWRDARTRPGAREIGIVYKLASRQAGIPGYFIAREHAYTTGLHWRHGALLHDRDPDTPSWALVTDDGREQPTITLRVTGAFPVRFRSVLTEALDRIITDRYPGLVESRLVPCACCDADDESCTHAFTLKELLVEATAEDGDRKVRCPESRRRIEATLMLDGLSGTGLTAQLDAQHRELVAGLNALNRQEAAQSSALNEIDAHQQAQLNGIRTLLEHRANTDTHCPGLFSIRRTERRGLHPAYITLALWCEWPSGPHELGEKGTYAFTAMPDALIRYLPYLRMLITTLGLATPALGAVGHALNDQTKDQIEAASRTLEFIEKHTDTAALAPKRGILSPYGDGVYVETGADFRALRDTLHAMDPDNEKNWGDLSPVARPEDRRIIYLCPHHIHELNYPYVPANTIP